MKHILSLAGAVLLLGLAVALPANAKMKEEAVWTPQITLNHFEPVSVEATSSSFYLALKRTNSGAVYYLVLRMWVNENGAIEVIRSCEGNWDACLMFSHGKDCDSDPVPWCYMGK